MRVPMGQGECAPGGETPIGDGLALRRNWKKQPCVGVTEIKQVQARTPLIGKRVLIVEDEPVIAIDHASALTEAGAEIVATCTTVHGAVAFLQERPIDVAVVDFVLADGNSEPVQSLLRQKHIPFVVVSSYPHMLVRSEPGQEVLSKPVTADLLCGRVVEACKLAA